MDVCCSWPGVLRQWHIDVSIRSPTSVRYTAAKLHPEHALQHAACEKKSRYGLGVFPLIFGVLGRIASESDNHLKEMATAASQIQDFGRPSVLHKTWRERLQRTLLWAQAATLALALGEHPMQQKQDFPLPIG